MKAMKLVVLMAALVLGAAACSEDTLVGPPIGYGIAAPSAAEAVGDTVEQARPHKKDDF